MAKTIMIKTHVWEMPEISKRYNYRICTTAKNRDWSIYKKLKEIVLGSPEDNPKNGPVWEFVETGFKSKASAVEYVEELATLEQVDPVQDLLNNIDDGIDLDD